MSTFKHKTNRGSLFTNDKKDMETKPDFNGSADIDGQEYFVSMWKSSADSKTEFSLSFTKKGQFKKATSYAQVQKENEANADIDDPESDLPF